MNFDVNKLRELFKQEDVSQYKDKNGNTKDIEDTSLFETKDGNYIFNDALKEEENFIETLFALDNSGLSKDQIKQIYFLLCFI